MIVFVKLVVLVTVRILRILLAVNVYVGDNVGMMVIVELEVVVGVDVNVLVVLGDDVKLEVNVEIVEMDVVGLMEVEVEVLTLELRVVESVEESELVQVIVVDGVLVFEDVELGVIVIFKGLD